MAIRVLGSPDSNIGRVLKPKKRDGESAQRVIGEGSETDRIEHESDSADNSSEPNTDGQTEFVDIDSIDTGTDNNQRTYSGKRRGRKPGSSNRNSSGKRSSSGTSKTTDSITSMLFVVHSVAGSLLKMPSIKISKESCNDLAEAIMQVTELYEIPLLDEKGMAWANLAATAVKVYIFNGEATVIKDEKNQKVHVISDPIPIPDFMRG